MTNTGPCDSTDLAQMVNTSLEQGQRLFAVVSVSGVQRKVTVEDVLVIETEFPPTVGDRLRLEKVGGLCCCSHRNDSDD